MDDQAFLSKLADQLQTGQGTVQTCYQMLVDVHNVCEEYDIEYWLDCGTLLGCLRSQGMIAWDDDADIGMMAGADADRFFNAAQRLFPALGWTVKKHYFGFKVFPSEGQLHPMGNFNLPCFDVFLYEQQETVADQESDKANPSDAQCDTVAHGRTEQQDRCAERPRERGERCAGEECASGKTCGEGACVRKGKTGQSKTVQGKAPIIVYQSKPYRKQWPNFFLKPDELFPLRTMVYGPLLLKVPARPEVLVKRFYGDNCLTHGCYQPHHDSYDIYEYNRCKDTRRFVLLGDIHLRPALPHLPLLRTKGLPKKKGRKVRSRIRGKGTRRARRTRRRRRQPRRWFKKRKRKAKVVVRIPGL